MRGFGAVTRDERRNNRREIIPFSVTWGKNVWQRRRSTVRRENVGGLTSLLKVTRGFLPEVSARKPGIGLPPSSPTSPHGNLDSQNGEIMALFDRLHSEGNTIVLVTHEHDIDEYVPTASST